MSPSALPDTDAIPHTDQSLLELYRSGDQRAAIALYARYAGRLRALAASQCAADLRVRFDPDDIVQSVFRTFFAELRESNYEVPEGEELWGLLFVMALHKIRNKANYHRAAKRNIGQTVDGAGLEENLLASDEASLQFLLMLIDDELKDYPPINRTIVRMRIEGYDIGEIVKKTERSRRTVERVLQDFRQKLTDQR
jgi:DNA-directed RNA polymerase specialized sigma24 family protein